MRYGINPSSGGQLYQVSPQKHLCADPRRPLAVFPPPGVVRPEAALCKSPSNKTIFTHLSSGAGSADDGGAFV